MGNGRGRELGRKEGGDALAGEAAAFDIWNLQRAWLEEKLPAAKGKSESLRAAGAGAWVLESAS
ncbi:hypothetical protein N8513_00540 [bacterium]|nr:hypothetical protein [bacterium]MDA7931653.1 hypothetical protein [Akkermansiaceae bacterium]MDA8968695.1 hypothetical protein [Akkermansiaceae bacterium]MDB4258667.1 hypothetical protein [Akkermansiaceae bacterium]MDB4272938.1 hypothetical protein [Akkermansiaceae bacterium]